MMYWDYQKRKRVLFVGLSVLRKLLNCDKKRSGTYLENTDHTFRFNHITGHHIQRTLPCAHTLLRHWLVMFNVHLFTIYSTKVVGQPEGNRNKTGHPGRILHCSHQPSKKNVAVSASARFLRSQTRRWDSPCTSPVCISFSSIDTEIKTELSIETAVRFSSMDPKLFITFFRFKRNETYVLSKGRQRSNTSGIVFLCNFSQQLLYTTFIHCIYYDILFLVYKQLLNNSQPSLLWCHLNVTYPLFRNYWPNYAWQLPGDCRLQQKFQIWTQPEGRRLGGHSREMS